MSIRNDIITRLTAEFRPTLLEVIDESNYHRGHATNPGGGETHFKVIIASSLFRDRSLVEQHRMVYAALREPLSRGVHALALDTRVE
ncbi:MAG: BolA family transcriptional regulator [Leptospiraceae bacterium]|nr:BolA family transcriptional regulator [Leptospiraceae bacterium]